MLLHLPNQIGYINAMAFAQMLYGIVKNETNNNNIDFDLNIYIV